MVSTIMISSQRFHGTTPSRIKIELMLGWYLIAKFGLHDDTIELRV